MIKINDKTDKIVFSRVVLFGLLLVFSTMLVNAGNLKFQSKKLTLDLKNVTIEQLIDEIENASNYRFVYKVKDVDINRKISINVINKSIRRILRIIFHDRKVDFNILDYQVYLYKISNTKGTKIPIIKLEKIRVSGVVTDELGRPLPGTNVLEKGTTNGVVTDRDGKYSVDVEEGAVLEFTFLG